jgi:predicted GTPase
MTLACAAFCCCIILLHSAAAAAARQGLVPADEELLGWLRRHCRAPLSLLANKADTAAGRNSE